MSLEFWSSALKLVGYFGAVFVLISTIGLGFVNGKLDEIKDQKIDDLVSGKNLLIKSVDSYKKQVEEKQDQIDELSRKAANAERGVSSTFDFNGTRRVTNGGHITVVTGTENRAFVVMNQAIVAQEWAFLIDLCSTAIDNVPKWWTAYYFRSMAYINTGSYREAKADLQTVIENVGDSPDYAKAKEWLILADEKIAAQN